MGRQNVQCPPILVAFSTAGLESILRSNSWSRKPPSQGTRAGNGRSRGGHGLSRVPRFSLCQSSTRPSASTVRRPHPLPLARVAFRMTRAPCDSAVHAKPPHMAQTHAVHSVASIALPSHFYCRLTFLAKSTPRVVDGDISTRVSQIYGVPGLRVIAPVAHNG